MSKKNKKQSQTEECEMVADDDGEDIAVIASTKDLNVIYTLNNHLYYYRSIDSEGAALFCKTLTELYYNIVSSMLVSGLTKPTIEIHINSPGGSPSDAFAMVAKIEEVKKGIGAVKVPMEVITIVEGECCSGGSVVSVAGSRRKISEYAYMLSHKLSCFGLSGKTDDLKQEMENIELVNNTMKKIYKKYSKLDDPFLEELMSKDIYLSPEKCLEYGFVDEII